MITPQSASSSFSTNCDQCGGVAQEVAGQRYLQCSYCQSLVFPHGSPLQTDRITPLGSELESACPCCQEPLRTGEIDSHRALYCGNCYGILIRNGTFGEILRNRRAARAEMEAQDVRPISPDAYDRVLHCPSCHGRMETHPYYGPGNVVIDSCAPCGCVWLDHGELLALERAAGRP